MSDIKKDFDIESDALDVEWLRQPKLRLKYGELSAETKKKARDLKQKVKQISAEISKEVRDAGGKVTDSLITMNIELDPRYKEAIAELSQALYEDDVISGRLDAVNDKKVALENEVRMWIGNYFAGPKTPRDLQKEFQPSDVSAEDVREKLLDHGKR